MKSYEIHSEIEFNEVVKKFLRYFEQRREKGFDFESITLISKKYRKPKSSRQHQAYWRCIAELKKAFQNVGYVYNDEQLHHFVKMASGFTESKELPDGSIIVVVKSIADNSEDATSEDLNFLIEWMLRFAQEKLDYFISIDQ